MKKTQSKNSLLQALPSVDSLLKTEVGRSLGEAVGSERLTALARRVTDDMRKDLISNSVDVSDGSDGRNGLRQQLLKEAERRIIELDDQDRRLGLQRVVNATGVILHTNLGRACLSEAAREAVQTAAGYCNLEYDLGTGERGSRGARAEHLLAELTGAAAALIVNNCAAAAVLVLSTLARDGETVVSRGELVEIGGDFRVPDVMTESGTRMVEVGTTNRTRLSDYRKAINENTRLLIRVHTSNYRIVGFTKTPGLSELAELAHGAGLLLYEDAGSGALVDLTGHGISGEPVIRDSIKSGADVVTFSGDKLLGGPQGGLVVGSSEIIERMRRHPLYRALRADKFRLAALEATLDAYSRGDKNPTQQMMALTGGEIEARADDLIGRIKDQIPKTINLKTMPGESAVGGGSAPTSPLPTTLICVNDSNRTANQLESALRNSRLPVLVRILSDQVVIDLRTVAPGEETAVEQALVGLA
jgi:L-seryl-tRNA(Ser) seleniumtransferase